MGSVAGSLIEHVVREFAPEETEFPDAEPGAAETDEDQEVEAGVSVRHGFRIAVEELLVFGFGYVRSTAVGEGVG